MIDSFTFLVFILITIVATLVFQGLIRGVIEQSKKEKNYKRETPENDEYIYDAITGGKMTLEQAENDYSFINPEYTEDGSAAIKTKTISHEEAIQEKFDLLNNNLKQKIDKNKLSALISLIEFITYPNDDLTDNLLDATYYITSNFEVELDKEEIRVIWEI